MKYHFLIPYVDKSENHLIYEENLKAIQSILELRYINSNIGISIVVNDSFYSKNLNISNEFIRISSSLNYFVEKQKKYLSPIMCLRSFLSQDDSLKDDIFVVINSDICISKNIFDFFESVSFDSNVHIVNRRTVSLNSSPYGSVEVGCNHGGYDLFIFSAETLVNFNYNPKFYIGGNHYGKCMILLFSLLQKNIIIHKNLSISYHYGDDKLWKRDKRIVSSVNCDWFKNNLKNNYKSNNAKLLNYLHADLLKSPLRQTVKLYLKIFNK